MTEPKLTSRASWQPPTDLISHAGSPLTVDADFFIAPPPQIGELISAATTLPTSSHPLPVNTRWAIIVGGSVISAILSQVVFQIVGLTLLVGMTAGGIAWYLTRFDHTCSFVGKKGLARYDISGSRSALPKEILLLFADTQHLHTKTTRNYTNGAYTGTKYSYRWIKNSGNQYYGITGTYRSENNTPKPQDIWHFADMAESAWTMHLLESIDDQLAKDGYIEFPLTGNLQAVRVGDGFLEFVTRKDEVQRVMRSEMQDITLGSGMFQFKHQDSRWWSGKGKFSFEYSNIPNARVFMICLKELADIYWN
jgi:hypothetical protein